MMANDVIALFSNFHFWGVLSALFGLVIALLIYIRKQDKREIAEIKKSLEKINEKHDNMSKELYTLQGTQKAIYDTFIRIPFNNRQR